MLEDAACAWIACMPHPRAHDLFCLRGARNSVSTYCLTMHTWQPCSHVEAPTSCGNSSPLSPKMKAAIQRSVRHVAHTHACMTAATLDPGVQCVSQGCRGWLLQDPRVSQPEKPRLHMMTSSSNTCWIHHRVQPHFFLLWIQSEFGTCQPRCLFYFGQQADTARPRHRSIPGPSLPWVSDSPPSLQRHPLRRLFEARL